MSNERPRKILNFDPILLVTLISLITIGVLFIYSSGVNSSGVLIADEYVRQILWGLLALFVVVTFNYINYNLLREFSFWLYILFVALLILTLFFGKVVNGAKAWLGVFGLGGQPSEFTKIVAILFLAKFLEEKRAEITQLSTFLRALLIFALPMFLILRQPDTGTTLVFVPIFLMMLFMAGAKISHIFFVGVTGILSLFCALLPFVETIILKEHNGLGSLLTDFRSLAVLCSVLGLVIISSFFGWRRFKRRIFYWILYVSMILLCSLVLGYALGKILKEYQVMRFIVFLDPSIDPKGSGWNLIQSMTAIGSGGFSGKGFLQGTQSHYRFLPMQSTDFIFSILGEEWGFIGVILVFGLFLALLIRLLYIMQVIKDQYGVLVIGGFVAMFFTHIFINIGMTVGMMPVTGIPLYFLSYGGSSLVAGSLALGIVMNIYNRRFMF